MAKISLIIPYFNEEDSIHKTLENIESQELPPNEIIFVSSSSSDATFEIIENWVKSRPKKLSKNYLNINSISTTPSSSKNIGIRKSSNEWLAFMDCGLDFKSSWLKDQMKSVEKYNINFISGVCELNGASGFDSCAVAHTYGIGKRRICVPGSLINKSIFRKVGLFEENMRAGYDRIWQTKIKKEKIKRYLPEKHNVSYLGINYASNYRHLIKKAFLYSSAYSVRTANKVVIVYCLAPLFLAYLLLYYNLTFQLILLVYIVIRGYFLPFFKSMNKSKIKNVKCLIQLPIIASVYDLTRFFGFVFGLIKN